MRFAIAVMTAIVIMPAVNGVHAAQIVTPASKETSIVAPITMPSIPAKETLQPALSSINPVNAEAAVLKEQLALVREFQADLLQTVYWSLGVIAGLAVLLVGYGWFSNFKVYERDKETLVAEVTTSARNEIAALEQTHRGVLNDERARVDSAIDGLRTELRDRLDQLISEEVVARNSSLNTWGAGIDEKIEALDTKTARLFSIQRIQITRMQRQQAVSDKFYSLALTHGFSELEESLNLDSEYFIDTSLIAINENLEKGGQFSKSEIEKIPELLRRVSDKLSEARDAVQAKVAASTARDW